MAHTEPSSVIATKRKQKVVLVTENFCKQGQNIVDQNFNSYLMLQPTDLFCLRILFVKFSILRSFNPLPHKY